MIEAAPQEVVQQNLPQEQSRMIDAAPQEVVQHNLPQELKLTPGGMTPGVWTLSSCGFFVEPSFSHGILPLGVALFESTLMGPPVLAWHSTVMVTGVHDPALQLGTAQCFTGVQFLGLSFFKAVSQLGGRCGNGYGVPFSCCYVLGIYNNCIAAPWSVPGLSTQLVHRQ